MELRLQTHVFGPTPAQTYTFVTATFFIALAWQGVESVGSGAETAIQGLGRVPNSKHWEASPLAKQEE